MILKSQIMEVTLTRFWILVAKRAFKILLLSTLIFLGAGVISQSHLTMPDFVSWMEKTILFGTIYMSVTTGAMLFLFGRIAKRQKVSVADICTALYVLRMPMMRIQHNENFKAEYEKELKIHLKTEDEISQI